jgi:hypothetical protein
MKNIFHLLTGIVLLVLFTSPSGFAQELITGSVMDASSVGVEYATVLLLNAKDSTLAKVLSLILKVNLNLNVPGQEHIY